MESDFGYGAEIPVGDRKLDRERAIHDWPRGLNPFGLPLHRESFEKRLHPRNLFRCRRDVCMLEELDAKRGYFFPNLFLGHPIFDLTREFESSSAVSLTHRNSRTSAGP